MKPIGLVLALAAAALLAAPPATAGDGPIVALFDIQDKGAGLPPQTLDNLLELLSARLAQGGYQTVPRAQIRERLRAEAADSFRACYDESCQIELGRELAASKTLSTQVMKIGDSCQVTASLFDLMRAAAELAATAEAKCSDEASMLEAFKSIADQLVLPLQESKRETGNRLAALSAVLADAAAPRAERLPKAWEITRQIATDGMVAEGVRKQALQDFLTAFKGDNPHQAEGEALLKAFLPANLLVRTEPPGALVSVDGRPIGPSPVGQELKGGTHQVEASQAGYLPARRKITVTPAEKLEIALTLEQPPTHPLRLWGRIAFWSGVGVTALAAVATLPMVNARESWLEEGVPEKKDEFYLYRGLLIGGASAGAALIATGLILWALEPSGEDWAQEVDMKSGLFVAPAAGPGVVFSYTGRW
jgi:hypothetical protein